MASTEIEKIASEVWAALKENRYQLELLREQSKETSKELDKRFRETSKELDKRFKETDKKINKVVGMFGNHWGKLMEALVEPDIARLLSTWGIVVTNQAQRIKRHNNGDTLEIDLLLSNGSELVLVEVKTTASEDDVRDLLNDLKRFNQFFSEYKTYKVYGAIAGLDIPHQVSRQAYQRGLFVVSITGEGWLEIKNDKKFKPRNFGFVPQD